MGGAGGSMVNSRPGTPEAQAFRAGFTSLGFSPGLVFAPERRDQPDIFISHGSTDPVASIANSRDVLVPLLGDAGYLVAFVEFSGSHSLPQSVARTAFTWIRGTAP